MNFTNPSFQAMCRVNPEIAQNAENAVKLDWGTEAQIDAENLVFSLCYTAGIFTEDQAEEACLKATTPDMMNWVESCCEQLLMRHKSSYEVGATVETPLGRGKIVSIREAKKPEATILYLVKHSDFNDHDGDTFEFESFLLNHIERES